MAELLAPAGSFESLQAAVRCGADAVYIGGKSFSARQNADNFDFDEVEKAVEFCHLHDVKLHMALNTIVFDSQLDEFISDAKKYAEMGVDAFIIQDIGAAECIKNILPDMPLHASTQLTVHTVNGALMAKNLGFERVVLARELSYSQIEEICKLDIETEVFVHGALCMSVSGQCYMSAMIGSRSANRGLCAQPCRLPFSACENRNVNALSLKDLCLVNHINKLKEMGVDSFKIEGRMKRPEYVAAAVTEFRKAIDGLTPDTDVLKSVFSRSGFTDGYFTGEKADMFGSRCKDDVVSAETVFPELRELYRKESKCSEIDFSISVKKDIPVKVHISDQRGNSADISGEIPQTAIKRPVDNEQLLKQFSKLGDTVYNIGTLNSKIEENLMLPASSLNELRRNAVSELDRIRIEKNTPAYKINNDFKLFFPKHMNLKHAGIRLSIMKISQIENIDSELCESIEYISVPAVELENNYEKITENLKDKIIINPYRFIADEKNTESKLKKLYNLGFKKLMCSNIAYIQIGKKLGFEMHGDFGLNISNSYSMKKFAELELKDTIVSFELKINQIYSLADYMPYGVIAYGRLPLMLTRNCPIKNEVGCKNCTKSLTDRTGRQSPVICTPDYAEIFNSEKIYMADRLREINNVDFLVLLFTDETAEEVPEIISEYITGTAQAPEFITRGLLYRGIY